MTTPADCCTEIVTGIVTGDMQLVSRAKRALREEHGLRPNNITGRFHRIAKRVRRIAAQCDDETARAAILKRLEEARP